MDIANDSAFVVTDNVANDATKKPDTDNDMGDISVAGLKSGRWCVTETAAPTGWSLDPDTECFTVGPTTAEATRRRCRIPDVHRPAEEGRPSGRTRPSHPGIDGTKPLDGVTFNLYADVAGAPGATPIDTQVTGPQGHASFEGLDWQKSYWLEEVALDGYRIGLNPNPKPMQLHRPRTAAPRSRSRSTTRARSGRSSSTSSTPPPRTSWPAALRALA